MTRGPLPRPATPAPGAPAPRPAPTRPDGLRPRAADAVAAGRDPGATGPLADGRDPGAIGPLADGRDPGVGVPAGGRLLGVAGVEAVWGDLGVLGSVRAACQGVEAVFLVWPFASTDGLEAVLEVMAREVRRVVYLSSAAVREHERRAERLIERSGLEWTILRPHAFAANALRWAGQIRAGQAPREPYGGASASPVREAYEGASTSPAREPYEGTSAREPYGGASVSLVRGPYGGAAMAVVHEGDIAAVAARALAGGHAGAVYELTGPQSLTQAEQARIIGEAIGRPVRWEETSPQDARREMVDAGLPPGIADGILRAQAAMTAGPAPVTATVREVTGAPARTFRSWAAEHAAAFRAEG
ncbi:NAD(P)H-binding protein [Microtetraspora sp. NBRC 13810]|uniref:NAD(P)H-binding protein n=1 Tax=Microtetraspora sp. NBRC 13810 TaxID=3030990 RepID=UPI002555ED86|nr:NAD(P)H-binding protein [Microtetraspora sp. NBRC 13810]